MTRLKDEYARRLSQALEPLAQALEEHVCRYFDEVSRIDRICARAKSIESFLRKSETTIGETPKYKEPLRQIQDQIGVRIITFYVSDVERIDEIVLRYFRPVETRDVVPDSEWEFGYFGRHHVLLMPDDVIDPAIDKELIPEFFELQIKTLFQHAWSEANHDLGYKPEGAPKRPDAKRRLAFTSAQAWGADHIFDDLFRESMD